MRLDQSALEHGNLRKVLVSFCVPALLSSLVTSVYNIVDQLFIGNQLGVLGNAATNVVFPAVTMITALSLMCGVGASAAMNLALGRAERDEAGQIVGNAFSLMMLCSLLVTVTMLLFTEPLLTLFGCTEAVMPYALPYARITAIGYPLALIGAAGPFLLRADGAPRYALLCTVVGSIVNIGLDALFIFAFGWGIRGAAWATVLSQGLGAAMVLLYLPKFHTVSIGAKQYRPIGKVCLHITALGAGPMCNFLTQALVQVFLNGALRQYGAMSACGSVSALAVAGVAMKVNTLAVAVVTGLSNGMQPIVSYNYGRKNYARVNQAARMIIGAILAISFMIFAGYQLFSRQITALFGDGDEAYFAFAQRFFRIFFLLIGLDGLQSSVGGFFSAQGKPLQSIFISLTRQVLMLPPLLMFLPRLMGLDGVLWAGPIADGVMAALAITLLRREMRRLQSLQQGLSQAC